MKNKLGKISGFIVGVSGFLFLFKIIVLNNVPPSDELAPGLVMIIAALNGLLFSFIGAKIQQYFERKANRI